LLAAANGVLRLVLVCLFAFKVACAFSTLLIEKGLTTLGKLINNFGGGG
jgi:hypothetical protein